MSKTKLTEAEWLEVFEVRCRSKRGERLSRAESQLCVNARNENQKRYAEMDETVFNATVPAGSTVRYRRD